MSQMAVADEQLIESASRQADLCQVFGNVTRILILWTLIDRELCVGDIATTIGSSCHNTSQHLRLMKDRGILASQRRGHAVYYSINGHELMRGCPVLGHAARVPQQFHRPSDPFPSELGSQRHSPD
jgi:DNA-binding transcriptional ArsR family regulator